MQVLLDAVTVGDMQVDADYAAFSRSREISSEISVAELCMKCNAAIQPCNH